MTVRILTAQGTLVRSLLSSTAKPAGQVSVAWDRKDDLARRVAKGTYRVQTDAVDASGQTATASAAFSVS